MNVKAQPQSSRGALEDEDHGHDVVPDTTVDEVLDAPAPRAPGGKTTTSPERTNPHALTLAVYQAARELARVAQAALEKDRVIDPVKASAQMDVLKATLAKIER